MMLKRIVMGLAWSSAVVGVPAQAETPAAGPRLLYSFATTTGHSGVLIRDGLLPRTAGWVTFTDTVSCQYDGAFCDQGHYIYREGRHLSFGFGRTIYSIRSYRDEPGTYEANFLRGETVRLTVRELLDTEVVYAFATTTGRSGVLVRDGLLPRTPGWVTFTDTVSCQYDGAFCDQGHYIYREGSHLSFGFGRTTYSIRSYRDEPGTYEANFLPDESVRLTVVGAARTVAVPEPATWAMMILGLGATGLAVRARRPARVSAAIG